MTAPYEPFVLPDAGKVKFLANASDPRPGKEGTVYGTGHVTTYDATDLEFIRQCYLDGKIALIEPLPPVVEFEQPTNFPPPPPEQPAARSKEEQPKRTEEQPRRR